MARGHKSARISRKIRHCDAVSVLGMKQASGKKTTKETLISKYARSAVRASFFTPPSRNSSREWKLMVECLPKGAKKQRASIK